MANVLIINGHPDPGRLSSALADAYSEMARKDGALIHRIDLSDLRFDPSGRNAGTHNNGVDGTPLEPDLAKAQAELRWADHIVVVFPVRWATAPALLHAFFERTLLPEFAFRYPDKPGFPMGLLKGRSARVIATMDSPMIWDHLMQGRAMHNAISRATLGFCGISPVRETVLYGTQHRTPAEIEQFFARVRKAAQADMARLTRWHPLTRKHRRPRPSAV